MAELASSATNARKLDAILKKLDGSPSIEDWHDMATMLGQVSTKLDSISLKVNKLDEVVNGNGKPGLRLDVSKLQDGMNAVTRVTWIIVGAVVSFSVAAFIYLTNAHSILP